MVASQIRQIRYVATLCCGNQREWLLLQDSESCDSSGIPCLVSSYVIDSLSHHVMPFRIMKSCLFGALSVSIRRRNGI